MVCMFHEWLIFTDSKYRQFEFPCCIDLKFLKKTQKTLAIKAMCGLQCRFMGKEMSMVEKNSEWEVEYRSENSVAGARGRDQSETAHTLRTEDTIHPFRCWTKIYPSLVNFCSWLWVLISLGLFFWGIGIIMGGALLFDNVLCGFLFGALLMFGSSCLMNLYASLNFNEESTESQTNTDEPIPTYSCTTDDPKYIQELEYRQWKRRQEDSRARTLR